MKQELTIERIYNSPVESNCYLIYKKGTPSCIIVDPAQEDNSFLCEYISSKEINPEYIILTHEHFDHISSVEYLTNKYNCKVISSDKCSDSIGHPKKNLSFFYDQVGFSCAPADVIIAVNEMCIQWNSIDIRFLLTPGHSEGGLCFSIGNNLFTGDTLIKDHKTIVKLPGGNQKKLKESIARLFHIFHGDTTLYPGHGQSFKLLEANMLSISIEQ